MYDDPYGYDQEGGDPYAYDVNGVTNKNILIKKIQYYYYIYY